MGNILRLEKGRSYIGYLGAFSAAFFGGVVVCVLLGVGWLGAFMVPAEIAILVICQLRSGVALDSSWTASFEKGTWQYRGLIAWETFAVLFFVAGWCWICHDK